MKYRGLIRLVLLIVLTIAFNGYALTHADTSTPALTPNSSKQTQPLEPITAANADRVKPLKRLGLGKVAYVSWSLDGKLLAVCGSAGIWLYPSDKLDQAPRLLEGTADCQKLAFSPNGQLIASFGNLGESTVSIWETTTGNLRAAVKWKCTCDGDPGWIYSVAFSPDSTKVAFGGSSGVQVLDLITQQHREFSTLPYATVTSGVAFSPDGLLLAAGELYGVDLWDVKAGEKKLKLTGGLAQDVIFSADGKTIAGASGDSVRLWNVTGGQRAVLFNNDNVYTVQFNPDLTTILAGNASTIVGWDTRRFIRRSTINNPFSPVQNVVFSPDGTLAAGIDDHQVRGFVWQVKTGQLQATLQDFTSQVNTVRFSPIGPALVFAASNGVWLWDNSSDTSQKLDAEFGAYYWIATFSSDGKRIYGSLTDPHYTDEYKVWDTTSGQELGVPKAISYGDRRAISLDGRLLAIARPHDSIDLIDLDTGEIKLTLSGHTDMIRFLTFSPDGKLLASSANDSTLRIWDVATGGELLRISAPAHLYVADFLAFSHDNAELASDLAGDSTIMLWDTRTGKTIASIKDPSATIVNGGLSALAYSLDDSVLASGAYTGAIHLWNVKTGTLAATLMGHLGNVSDINFSFDGKILASASQDGTVYLWGATRQP